MRAFAPTLLLLCASRTVAALNQCPPAMLTPSRGSLLVRSVSVPVMDEGSDSFSNAFAKLARARQPLKPGEGSPTSDVRGMPVRKGGSTRDGSLGAIAPYVLRNACNA